MQYKSQYSENMLLSALILAEQAAYAMMQAVIGYENQGYNG